MVFDIGGVLVDETRMWRGWAAELGVPFETLWAALREDIRRGLSHRATMQRLAPGRDIAALRRARLKADLPVAGDLYPDVRPALAGLAARGVRIGIAGNQPREAAAALAALGLGAAFIATSDAWGVQKPDPGFFARVQEACGAPAAAITYVGDRVDNDVLPALAAGMRAAFLPRGLWAGVGESPVPPLPDLLALL
ncbi:MAG: HAD family hydrolase [Rhodovarius sp.]|nr:HAD family hydrolase [Rhodovarius sp.]MCX7930918.1 HAD family hydrolase [Rhodovarius sp.]MDW8313742.1 HAD family hydrolase [Rhodovarius sp.]